MKIKLIEQQISNKLLESPDNITDDNGNFVDYRDHGTYPFALNTENNEVYVGDEMEGHGDREIDIGDGRSERLRNYPFKFQGRIFSNQRVLTFWTYPEKEQLKHILNDLNKKTKFNFFDGSWKIEIYEYDREKDRNTWKKVPINSYVGSEKVHDIYKQFHFMTPVEKEELKKKYKYLLSQPINKLSDEDKELLTALKTIFITVGGSNLTAWDSENNLRKRQIQYKSEGEVDINNVIEEEIDGFLKENPDGFTYIDDFGNNQSKWWHTDGTYAFGYFNDEMYIIDGGTHGDLGDLVRRDIPEIDNDVYRQDFLYPGRIWTNQKVISFWSYPQPNEIRNVLMDLEYKLNIPIVKDKEYKIEVSADVNSDYFDSETNKGNNWSNNENKAISIEQYENISNPEELKNPEGFDIDHDKSPLLKKQREIPVGVGSKRYGEKMPIQYKQRLRQEGIEDIVEEEINGFLKENPDNVFYQDGSIKKNLKYADEQTFSFALNKLDNSVEVGDESSDHGDSGLVGNEYIYPGRLWLNEKVISFWTYPNEEEFKNIINQLSDNLNTKMWNNGWKIEVYNQVARGTKDYYEKLKGDVELINIEDFAGSEDVPEIYKEIHRMSPIEKEDFKKKYKYLLSQPINTLSNEDKEILNTLKNVFINVGGSKLTAWDSDNNLRKRQIQYKSEGEEDINNVIGEEIEGFLKENPDSLCADGKYIDDYTCKNFDAHKNHMYKDAIAFGIDEEGDMMVTRFGDNHYSQGGGRSKYSYPGRLWLNSKIMSFWVYPPPKDMETYIHMLENELNKNATLYNLEDKVDIWNDGRWLIELPTKKIIDKQTNIESPTGAFDPADWKNKQKNNDDEYDFSFKSEIIPLRDYPNLSNVGQRSREELERPHREPSKNYGGGSKLTAFDQPNNIAYRQAKQTSESENIFEQVEKILKEWDDTDEWLYDLYEERDNIMRDTIVDFMSKPPTARQPWKVVPFGRLKKIWEDAAKIGVVRDTQGLQEIQDRMIRNLLKLDVNTELLGHMQAYPDESMFEDAGTTREAFEEKLSDWDNNYFSSSNGQNRVSDYGLKPLWKYAEQLIKEKDPIKKIQYVDQMLNIVHARSDMAENFIEGGSNSLTTLFNGEQERKWEVHRPL